MLSDAEAPVQGRSTKTLKAATTPGDLKTLGKYQVEKKLGAGGMGTVYLARDTKMRRAVALKVLPKDKAENPILVKRFEAEAASAAQLTHDNIVAVYDSGAADGYLYIAMEYVDGIDLHELVNKRGPIPVKRSIEIIKQVASALQHAHEKNIVHRDIKPSNLLIRRDGIVKLTDLGLARSIDDTIETGITRAGTTVGTVDYMAPEQAKSSKAADVRSDIYSLGCTWYHMLTGGPPYPDGSLTNKLQAHAVKPLPDPRTVNDQVTESLVAVMHRMMAKKPEDRYQTPADLLKDLETSVLTKAAFSQEIFDAIDEESAADVPTRPAKATVGPAGSPLVRQRGSESEDKQGINFEVVKLGGAIVAVVGVVLGIGWLVGGFGGVLDGPGQIVKNPVAPQNDQPGKNEVTVAPVGGNAVGVGATPLVNTTEVAPVFGSGTGTALQPGTGTAQNLANGSTPIAIQPGTGTAFIPGASGTGVGSNPPTGTGSSGAPPPTQPYDPLKVPSWVTEVSPATMAGTGAGASGTGSTGGSSTAGTGKTPGTPGSTPPVVTPGKSQATGTTAGSGAAPPVVSGIRNVTVGPSAPPSPGNSAPATSHVHSLDQALTQAQPDGTAIQLVGNGPFVINAPIAVKSKRLVISAAENSQPLIVFAPGDQDSFGGFNVTGGTLELRGLHITADAPPGRVATLLSVRDGSAYLSGCSITVGGDASGITALNVDGIAPTGARVLLDQTVIRGDVRAALNLHTSTVDAVIKDSLIVVGSGSAVRMAADSSIVSPHSGQPPRSLRCLHSTLASRGRVVDITADADRTDPPALHVAMVNSVCCTGGTDGSRLLLDATGWRQDNVRERVTWTSHDSVCLGFQSLVDFGSPPALHVKDSDAWRVFWRQRAESDQFRDEVWPRHIDQIAGANIGDFDGQALPDAVRKAGEIPGATAARLKVPAGVAPERLSALAHRRMIPPALQEPIAADKVTHKVDLKKEDLGVVLTRGDWPDGAVFEATGFGVCYITPATITQRRLSIIFRQGDGATLRLMAKDSNRESEALFRVDQGTLVLDSLRWQLSDPKSNGPQWLVSGNNSNIVLRNCDLLGPERAAGGYQGLVKFSTEGAADNPPRTLVISDSFLHSPGALVRGDVTAGSIFVRNSLLVARGTVFDLRPRAVGDDLPLVVDAVQSTLSATQSVFQWTAASLSQPPHQPARVFVDRCVFGPPFALRPGEASQPTVLTWSGPVMDQHQVEWWGLSNGVATEIKHMLHPEGALPSPDKTGVKAWETTWGPGHELRLLTKTGGVMLAEDQLPTNRDALKPKSFQLHANSKAFVWAEGRPIGAEIGSLDDVGPEKIDGGSKPATKKSTQNPPATKPMPKSTVPGF